ncbi:MAG TPA: hypothetical protein VKU02_00215 [Gemmataceae bacterium]|nr:hypothetical protein [Gemmataceae bacterium]
MDPQVHPLIQALHQSSSKCVLAMTGGGSGAAALLLGVPGASRTVLEVIVPYCEQALVEFLGRRPEQFCSVATSRALALRAYERAAWLAPGEKVLGLGCTASLATDRPKRGEHRFYLTCQNADRTLNYSLTLRKGERSRAEEEAVLDSALLNLLAAACAINERVPVALRPGEAADIESSPSASLVSSLLRSEVPAFCAHPDGRLSADAPRPGALLSGAFNPAHHGHWGLAVLASRLLGMEVAFELSVTNVDKPALPAAEIHRRLQQFTWRAPVWVTRAATFVEKASLFPRSVFVVGADTAARIVAPHYYEDSQARMAGALEQIRRQGCRFLVACREDRTGKHVSLEDLEVPAAYRDLFGGIAKDDFSVPISSTALRGLAVQTD